MSQKGRKPLHSAYALHKGSKMFSIIHLCRRRSEHSMGMSAVWRDWFLETITVNTQSTSPTDNVGSADSGGGGWYGGG